MKQTLIDIQALYVYTAKEAHREPTPQELAQALKRRMPVSKALQDRYWRGMGEFIGQALAGVVIDPKEWNPPD